MKRDMDLVRSICFAAEQLPPGHILDKLDGVDAATFAAHLQLMQDAGLVTARVHQMLGGEMSGWAERLTWAGHDFADAARSETLWKKAKESVIRPGASWTFDVLKEWLKAEIRNGFPTLGNMT